MPKAKLPKGAGEQVEIVAQFSYNSISYFISPSFDTVVREFLPELFGGRPAVNQIEREAKEVSGRERQSH